MWGSVSRALNAGRMSALLTGAMVGGKLYPRTAAEIAAAVTPTDYTYAAGDVRRYGAVGDGVANDTAALQNALNSSHDVRGERGRVYAVNPLTQSTAGQVIDMTGATVRRRAATAHAPMLTLNGAGARVISGEWDGNKAAQAPSPAEAFAHCAVNILADRCSVVGLRVVNHAGMGVKGSECSYAAVTGNTAEGCDLYGIYIEGTAADRFGNRVSGNTVLCAGIAAASGIYLTGSNGPAFTYKQQRWVIANNILTGDGSGAVTGIGITTRGVDGVIEGNVITGFTMGISADIAERTAIIGNRCADAAGTTAYGIELNGGYCAVTGNVVIGGKSGIVLSSLVGAMPFNVVAGNYLQNQSQRGIYADGSTNPVQHLTITGNSIQLNGATTGRTAITLAGDCRRAHIAANQLTGPGSGVGSCRAVLLDAVGSHVSIVANRIAGWERALDLYSAGALAYTDIAFNSNDCSLDVPGPLNFVVVSGAASFGARVTEMWNNSAVGVQFNYVDRAAGRIMQWSDTYATPEANVAAAIGSLYINTNGGAGTTLFVKQSGAGNTGWAGK